MRPSRLVPAAVVVALLAPAAAVAHGDPVGDGLYDRALYVPPEGSTPAASAGQLRALLDEAKAKGYPLRVAVVERAEDLGTEAPLFGRPDRYAPRLADDLHYRFAGPVLVVTPSGYGFAWYRRDVEAERRLLATLREPSAAPDLARAAVAAVVRLAALRGVRLAPPPPTPPTSERRDRILIAVGGVTVLAAVSLGAYRRRPAPR